jgi:DUF1707 SHOCT-like domain
VATGPGDSAGAGHGRLRAGHADREQVIEALKSAFVDGRLTKDELAARTGRALKARTYADLAALTADLPAGPAVKPVPVVPAVADPAVPALAETAASEAVPAPPAAAGRRPVVRAAAASGICLVVAAVAAVLFALCDPEGNGPYSSWAGGFFLLAIMSVMAAVSALGWGVTLAVQQWHSRRQLPPQPPSGRALSGEQHGDAGPGPALPGYRTDETQTDLRARKPRQRERRIAAWAGRAQGGGIPAPGAA